MPQAIQTTIRKPRRGWKILRRIGSEIVSDYDCSMWTIGKWRQVEKPPETCVGLNCCQSIDGAFTYVHGTVIAKVEYKGAIIDDGQKITCEYMRIIKAWAWPSITMERYRKQYQKSFTDKYGSCSPEWNAYQNIENYYNAGQATLKKYRMARHLWEVADKKAEKIRARKMELIAKKMLSNLEVIKRRR